MPKTPHPYKRPSIEEIRRRLTPEEFKVTQEEATEPPYHNEYWNFFEAGLYVDRVTGEPLFTSMDKYDAGCGWPSFTRPIHEGAVTFREDHKLYETRTEVRSTHADSHLGHVFDHHESPTHKRYCINSLAIRFIPLARLEEEGYGEYKGLFEEKGTTEKAVLAGGCFWGVQDLIRKLPGVKHTRVGYIGGQTKVPSYREVKTGETNHAEACEILFDPKILPFQELLLFFFRIHDPTSLNRQGNDVGTQYRSAIFYQNEEQKRIAEEVIAKVEKLKWWPRPLLTQVVEAQAFYPAEEYHQDYLLKNPAGYTCHYIRPF